MRIPLENRTACPHCECEMDLMHSEDRKNLSFACMGCKAEYDAGLSVGKTIQAPVCGAKRVQTRGF